MTSIGKKILSAFVEVTDEGKQVATPVLTPPAQQTGPADTPNHEKFRLHFDGVFGEAHLPSPDYYTFSRMVDAMSGIPDEKARYLAAYVGLQVQGLNKQLLLSTASQYLQLLDADAQNFHSTINTALEEKVQARKKEVGDKQQRIEALTKEISAISNQITLLTTEVKENEEKIRSNAAGYQEELSRRKQRICDDIEKIKQHIN
jgi:hypothetical protein